MQASPCLTDPVRVLDVLDGDTIEVEFGTGATSFNETIRVAGVDTPELKEQEVCAEAARAYTEANIGTHVQLSYEADCASDPLNDCDRTFDRLVGYVQLADCTDLSLALLQNGLAKVYWEDFDRKGEYLEAYVVAQAAGVGMHGAGCP